MAGDSTRVGGKRFSEALCSYTEKENVREFLERTEATSILKHALLKLIANQPSQPIAFLCNYFETLSEEKRDRVQQAISLLSLTSYTNSAIFERNLISAFDLLTSSRDMTLGGITGAAFMDIISALTNEFPHSIGEQLSKKYRMSDYTVVTFASFRSAIYSCFMFNDFLSCAHEAYTLLDLENDQRVNRKVCEAILLLLTESADISVAGTPSSLLQASGKFVKKNIAQVVHAAQVVNPRTRVPRTMSRDDFIASASTLFLSKIS